MEQKSWPFIEAKKILEHTKEKDIVTFATGYGPSGPPHIGTFGEVARTTMVINAFRQLSDKPVRLIVFSDDMDALRKVPENVPNRDMLEEHINEPLSSIPNPFDTEHESYAAHNNAMLCQFLDQYGFEYEFMSSTDCYKNGIFNETLSLIAEHLDEIKEIVTHDFGIKGGNRKETYCPFLPIVNGKVIQEVYDWRVCQLPYDYKPWMLHFFTEPSTPERTAVMKSFHNGECKLQWKVDWAMRWIALGIDYEMHGKDLISSAQVGQKICRLLKRQAPINFMYELFLDEEGEKISKSRGNGLELNEWLRYSTPETVQYYMFQNPRKSRRLHFDIIPQMTDDYIKMIDKYNESPDMDNPVWHVHNGNVPTTGSPIPFSMLLNLASITNTTDSRLLWEFVRNYVPEATAEKYPMLDGLIKHAISYYEDKVFPFKNYRTPTEQERVALISLHGSLRLAKGQHDAMIEHMITNAVETEEMNQIVLEESITSVIYEVGKQYYGEEKNSLREFFKMIYEVVMGQSSGPRLPVFVMLLGIEKFLIILKEKLR